MEIQIFDVIIVGGGPAGLSAAIYTARKNLKTLVVTKNLGGNIANANMVENYLGFSEVTGPELVAHFRNHLGKFNGDGLEVKEGVGVTDISGTFPNFTIVADDGSKISGKTIIIAAGRVSRKLGIPGEDEFLGKGVAVCATCDAPLYKGRDVAVVGGGNSALDGAYALLKIAKSVTMINIVDSLTGDMVLRNKVETAPNVKILNNHEAVEVLGDKVVSGLKIRNRVSGKEQILPVTGVFIEIGYTPATSFDKLTQKNDKGEIMVNDEGKTSVEGIWAAGDIDNLGGEQMIVAAGEGAKTALAVARFLAKN
ncbi:FAD-dependent oxidoreductase [Candidatus Daviesbacteria bacterium]|nr:FAD-dependent oxidoreductase [Candidatus Daviesbacteria bacterium]